MSVLIYVQDLSQLEANCGREYAAGIRGNCDTQVFYRPTETSTAKYVTDRAGKTSIPYLNVVTDGWGEVKSESQVWKHHELITVSELMLSLLFRNCAYYLETNWRNMQGS